LDPNFVFTEHEAVVEEVNWHKFQNKVFGSVGDDKCIRIWDLRKNSSKSVQYVKGSKKEINAIDFSPFNEYIFCTGGNDFDIRLWDLRNLKTELHTLKAHSDEIFSVQFNPNRETILASSGTDRRVNIWDISKIGAEQSEEDAEDGPPELLFIHGGHISKVSDFSWNKNDDFMIATAGEDNIIQIWKCSENIYNDDYENDINLTEEFFC